MWDSHLPQPNNPFDNILKFLEKTVLEPTKMILDNNLAGQSRQQEKPPLLPQKKVAVFWDYENFPLPKDIHPMIFFETLFPSGQQYSFVTKKVYGKAITLPLNIQEILKKNEFEPIEVLPTGKQNEADLRMTSECAAFCSQYKDPLTIILISGDIDFLSLVHTLSNQGHDVQLICQNRKQVRKELKFIVPSIIDKDNILNGCNRLISELKNLRNVLNYLISVHPENKISILEMVQEIQKPFLDQWAKTVKGRIELVLKSEEFNAPFKILDDGKITQEPLSPLLGDQNKKVPFNTTKLEALSLKLGSEPQQVHWDQYWKEFSALIPDKNFLANKLQGIYITCSLPPIRARIQNKLIEILESQSKTMHLSMSSSINHPNDTNTQNNSKIEPHNTNTSNISIKLVKCDSCNKKFTDNNAKNQHYKALHKRK